MFAQMKIKVLSETSNQQVINVQVTDLEDSPPLSLTLSGDFRGTGTIPADEFTMDKVIDVLWETIDIFKKYKGSHMIPRFFRDKSSHEFVPAMILIEK